MNQFPATVIKNSVMSSADPESNQGYKDISFSTVIRSTKSAIGGCLLPSRFDFYSGDCLIVFHLNSLITRWRKQTENFIKVFHDSMRKIVFFCFFSSSSQSNGKNLTGFPQKLSTRLPESSFSEESHFRWKLSSKNPATFYRNLFKPSLFR